MADKLYYKVLRQAGSALRSYSGCLHDWMVIYPPDPQVWVYPLYSFSGLFVLESEQNARNLIITHTMSDDVYWCFSCLADQPVSMPYVGRIGHQTWFWERFLRKDNHIRNINAKVWHSTGAYTEAPWGTVVCTRLKLVQPLWWNQGSRYHAGNFTSPTVEDLATINWPIGATDA